MWVLLLILADAPWMAPPLVEAEEPWVAPPLLTGEGDLAPGQLSHRPRLQPPAPDLGVEPTHARSEVVSAPGVQATAELFHRAGVQVDVGIPEGLGVTALLRPWHWLRLELGAAANSASVGLRGGVALVAFPSSTLRPTLGVTAGWYPAGDASWVTRDPAVAQLVSKVSYGYGAGHLGLEVGSQRIALMLRAGLAYVDASLGGQRLSTKVGPVTADELRVRAVIPSAGLGINVSFL